MAMEPLAMQLVFPKGDPNGIKIIELTGWNGKALIVPRTEMGSLKERAELKSGIYFLFGEDEETGEELVYVGESGDCAWRLGSHDEKKAFWNLAFVFLDPPNRGYLESVATRLAKEARRYKIENGVQPRQEDQNEFDRVKNERYFDGIRKILITFGFPIFESVRESTSDNKMYYVKGQGIDAKAQLLDDGSLNVLAGSLARKRETPSLWSRSRMAREEFRTDGTLKDAKNGISYVFTKDTLFKSPSSASSVVKGRASNGWTSWKDENGNTLDENLRK